MQSSHSKLLQHSRKQCSAAISVAGSKQLRSMTSHLLRLLRSLPQIALIDTRRRFDEGTQSVSQLMPDGLAQAFDVHHLPKHCQGGGIPAEKPHGLVGGAHGRLQRGAHRRAERRGRVRVRAPLQLQQPPVRAAAQTGRAQRASARGQGATVDCAQRRRCARRAVRTDRGKPYVLARP